MAQKDIINIRYDQYKEGDKHSFILFDYLGHTIREREPANGTILVYPENMPKEKEAAAKYIWKWQGFILSCLSPKGPE